MRTQGKWISKQTRGNNKYEHHIFSDQQIIARLEAGESKDNIYAIGIAETIANAEFICKAVNNHDKLVSDREKLLVVCKYASTSQHDKTCPSRLSKIPLCECTCHVMLCRAAIAEAEGNQWVFMGGGECKICHRAEVTEINSDHVCLECFKGNI